MRARLEKLKEGTKSSQATDGFDGVCGTAQVVNFALSWYNPHLRYTDC